MRALLAAVAVAVASFLPATGLAGTTGALVGTVRDAASGAPIALLTFRPLRLSGVIDYHDPSIFQHRVTSDFYVVTPVMPFYSFDGHDIYALHFVPGLTFGAGLVLSR